jgi:hypothetical protein
MFAIICTDGQITLSQLRSECVKGKWVPLLIYRNKETKLPILPIFNSLDIARQFSKRNLPKEWLKGCVSLTDVDMVAIDNRGLSTEIFDFPRKMTDLPDIEFDLEIHEFAEEPNFRAGKL